MVGSQIGRLRESDGTALILEFTSRDFYPTPLSFKPESLEWGLQLRDIIRCPNEGKLGEHSAGIYLQP